MQTQEKVNATPGPWSAKRSGRSDALLRHRGWNPDDPYQCSLRVYGNNRLICTLQDEYGDDAERRAMRAEQEANARLIAAAPELLEALQECITENGALAFASEDFYKAKQRLMAINNIARAAIAKAEGE